MLGLPKACQQEKEKKAREDPEKAGLLEDWEQIVGRIKRSGFDLSGICITLKEE